MGKVIQVFSSLRLWSVIPILLIFQSPHVFCQVDISNSISFFKAYCVRDIDPEETYPEFTLHQFNRKGRLIYLDFDILVNCAQRNLGTLLLNRDTLKIIDTEVLRNSYTYTIDSGGVYYEVTVEESMPGRYAFCDCLVNFYYEISYPNIDISYISFHGRIFRVRKEKIKGKRKG
jgi:hypothetical protein